MLLLKNFTKLTEQKNYYQGLLFYQVKNYARALPLLISCYDAHKSDEGYLLRLICCCLENGDPDQAQEYATQLLALNPQSGAGHVAQAEYYIHQGNYKTAKDFYLLIAEQNPDNKYNKICLAQCEMNLGELDNAQAALLEILSKGEYTDTIYYLLAQISWKKEDYDRALKQIKHSIGLHQKDNIMINLAQAYELNGDIHIKLKERAKAIKCYEHAIALADKVNLIAMIKIIDNEIHEERFLLAEKRLKKLIKDYEVRCAYARLGKLYTLTGRSIEAFNYYANYLTDVKFNNETLPAEHRKENLALWHGAGTKISPEVRERMITDDSDQILAPLVAEYAEENSIKSSKDIFTPQHVNKEEKSPAGKKPSARAKKQSAGKK